jgi:hypothetical protein
VSFLSSMLNLSGRWNFSPIFSALPKSLRSFSQSVHFFQRLLPFQSLSVDEHEVASLFLHCGTEARCR